MLLQLCDLCTYSVRRLEEQKVGRRVSETNRSLAELVNPLVYREREATSDVLAWLQKQYSETECCSSCATYAPIPFADSKSRKSGGE